jgi:DNA invertase Pin-like site-specific DNA recombinase
MLHGYARVSTADQHPEIQENALKEAGCERIWTDHGVSGKLASRPQLDACLAALQPGDTLVVWKLDRLGRSVQHLVTVINDLQERKVGFKSLTEALDTTTNGGRLIFHIFAAIAEFERGLIVERTMVGLAEAKRKGHYGGHPPGLTGEQAKLARQMIDSGASVAAVARSLDVSRATVYRHMERLEGQAAR